MRLGECPDLHGRILRIMLVDIQLQLLGNLPGVNHSLNSRFPFR